MRDNPALAKHFKIKRPTTVLGNHLGVPDRRVSLRRRQAIVTLLVGNRYRADWHRFAKRYWVAYAERHGLDVLALERVLDASSRASRRSPAWQKLLILSQDFARRYDQIIWVDADVVINPSAPLITEGVSRERVGAVDEYAFPSPDDHAIVVRRVGDALHLPPGHVWPTPQSFYDSWGLPGSFPQVVQSGVLVLSPKHHKDVLEHTYHTYEDRGGATWGEMHPLSFELLSNDLVHWLDQRFNTIWTFVKALHYPWLLEENYEVLRKIRGLRRLAFRLDEARLRKPLTTTFRNSYFLHFAGCPRDVYGLDMSSQETSLEQSYLM